MEQDILRRMVLFCKAAVEVHELNCFMIITCLNPFI